MYDLPSEMLREVISTTALLALSFFLIVRIGLPEQTATCILVYRSVAPYARHPFEKKDIAYTPY